jgi:hypothetical protein
MEGLIGSINNRLSRTKDPALKSPATEAKPVRVLTGSLLRAVYAQDMQQAQP